MTKDSALEKWEYKEHTRVKHYSIEEVSDSMDIYTWEMES
jgi:hypothetical protein